MSLKYVMVTFPSYWTQSYYLMPYRARYRRRIVCSDRNLSLSGYIRSVMSELTAGEGGSASSTFEDLEETDL